MTFCVDWWSFGMYSKFTGRPIFLVALGFLDSSTRKLHCNHSNLVMNWLTTLNLLSFGNYAPISRIKDRLFWEDAPFWQILRMVKSDEGCYLHEGCYGEMQDCPVQKLIVIIIFELNHYGAALLPLLLNVVIWINVLLQRLLYHSCHTGYRYQTLVMNDKLTLYNSYTTRMST